MREIRSDRAKPKPTKLLTIRVTEEERIAIKEAAKKYADNLSSWIRLAAVNYKPSSKDFIK